MTPRSVAAAQRLHVCKRGVAVGRAGCRCLKIFCADRGGKWEDHLRLAARRPYADKVAAGDSPWALDRGPHRGIEYPVAAPDDPRNVLTVRDSRDAPRTLIPHSEWQFAHTVDGKVSPNDRYIHLNGGFQPGKI